MTKCKIKLAPEADTEYKKFTITKNAYKQLVDFIKKSNYWLPVLFESPFSDLRYKKRRKYPSRVGFALDAYLQGNKVFMDLDVENEVIVYLNSGNYEVIPYIFSDIKRDTCSRNITYNKYIIDDINNSRSSDCIHIRIVNVNKNWYN